MINTNKKILENINYELSVTEDFTKRMDEMTPDEFTIAKSVCYLYGTLEHIKRVLELEQVEAEERFSILKQKWLSETRFLSSATTICTKQEYQEIIGMGKLAIPFMLRDFTNGELNHWFWALTAITGENPITEDIAGDMQKMADVWIDWGKNQGIIE